ncbi:MAG: RNA polymerase sigma-70 factor, partial [Chitinophagaceae bacterium]|nr:RNA polymerase sigma-70 factor [Chitinophagaceae bacterium]
ANDEQAFSHIYDRYWKSLYVTANNILQNPTAAQDIVQEVFTSLWQRRNIAEIDNLKSYLYQATRFQVFKAIREEKNDHAFYNRLKIVTQELFHEDPIVFRDLQHLIDNSIDSLPDDQKEIFMLSRTDGLTYAQIAERKNISVKTVEKKMSLALKHLRLGIDDTLILLMIIKRLI